MCILEWVEKFVGGGNMGIYCSALVQTFYLQTWSKPNNKNMNDFLLLLYYKCHIRQF